MKRKSALTVVIAAILLATMLLSSCGDKIKPVKSYFDIFDL
jgi:PBP1b-binding outer membrane lipoprotein LpoB